MMGKNGGDYSGGGGANHRTIRPRFCYWEWCIDNTNTSVGNIEVKGL